MKYLMLISGIILGLGSCNTDDNLHYHPKLLPIDNVTLPDKFKRDSIYEIPFKYSRPTTCYAFDGFYYEKEANIRSIAVRTLVFEQDNCTTPTTNPVTVKLNFKPTTENSYIFRIWKGKDSNGQNIFEETEVPVVP